jgi:hypothetical protein
MKKLLLSIFALSVCVTVNAQCSELFFSHYIQFGGSNKAVEIYNPTTHTIDLTGYIVERWKAASSGLISTTMNDSVHLHGSIAPYSTFVLCNGQMTAGFSPACSPDLQVYAQSPNNGQLDNIYGTYGSTTGAPMYFKGNDCLILRKPDGNPADIFGEIGVTVKYWSTIAPFRGGTGEGKWISKGYMLERKSGILGGVTAFPAAVDGFNILGAWDTIAHVYPISSMTHQDTLDTYSLFGQHTCDCSTVGVNNIQKDDFVTVFPNPSNSGAAITMRSSELVANVKIYDLTGALVYTETSLNKYEFSISTRNLSKGTYIVAVTTKSGLVQRDKITVE